MGEALGKPSNMIDFLFFSINKNHYFMSLDKSEIEKIAWLARLEIDAEDVASYSQELSGILELVEQMNSVDTGDITPLAHPLDIAARLRDDKVTETNQRDRFQHQAPETEDGYFLVPRVIE